jgi:aspartokinase-like uncharacterized kinase
MKSTGVDKFLPTFLSKNFIKVSIINGNFPERIRRYFNGSLKKYSAIIP